MKRLRTVEDAPIAGVNIVPVIDLCLVLLVILLIISPILDKPGIDVNLPKARTTEEKENNIAISLAPDGRIAVNSDVVPRKDLVKILRVLLLEQGEDVLVVIRADREVQYRALTELLKDVKSSGAKRISLGTDRVKEE
jgi:biopolymer transport protein ExbD